MESCTTDFLCTLQIVFVREDTSQAIAVKAVWLVFATTLQLSYSSSFCFLFCRVLINTLVLPIPIRVILLKGT